MFNKFPILTRTILFILLPLVVLVYSIWGKFHDSLMPRSGEHTLPGLTATVTVQFDPQGVPTVIAPEDTQAWFAQGYLHAGERMWQMELQRRLVDGRLAEIFGLSAVSSDVWMRTLSLRGAAQRALPHLSQPAIDALQAYADGVNAWLETTPVLQPEFLFFSIKPEPWQPIDSLAWQKVFALTLGKNMHEEMDRIEALKLLDKQDYALFYPYDNPLQNPLTAKNSAISETTASQRAKLAAYEGMEDIAEHMRNSWGIGNRFAGSNAWVVSGEHTQSGKPLLANDPHLAVQLPSLWYGINLKGDKLDVKGMSLVGMPGVILGRNSDIAWGVTNLMADQQDLFVLDIPLGDKGHYQTEAGLKPISSREEIIEIRRETPEDMHTPIRPLVLQVRTTELGPIVTDVINKSDETMVLRWNVLDETDSSFEAFHQLQYAKDWDGFRHAISYLKGPGLHFVYADEVGNIGSQVAGMLPKRGKGDGTFPQQADNTANYWQGYVPFEQLPSEYNPSNGYLVSANNHIASDKDVVISHEWAPMTRNNRISQMLDEKIAKDKLQLKDMQQMQLDQLDPIAVKVLPILNNKLLVDELLETIEAPKRARAELALQQIAKWDGRFDVASPGATIYQYWFKALKQEIFNNELATPWRPMKSNNVRRQLIAQIEDEKILDLISGKGDKRWCKEYFDHVVPCEQELYDAFDTMVKSLDKHTRSMDPSDWVWGKMHHVRFAHRPLGQINLFGDLFVTDAAIGGATHTVNVANAVKTESGTFVQNFGSTFRQVFDLSSQNESYYNMASGQSGHFMNDNYLDTMLPFIQGELYPYARQNDSGENSQHTTITLYAGGSK